MKSLTAVRSFPLPSDLEIRAFEELNNLELPKDYIEFLATQNVFWAEENYFVDGPRIFEVHHIYPFNEEFELSMQYVYSRVNWFFQGMYIPFADDSGGWQFVISLQDMDFGHVYFCRMDEELGKGFTHLAKSF